MRLLGFAMVLMVFTAACTPGSAALPPSTALGTTAVTTTTPAPSTSTTSTPAPVPIRSTTTTSAVEPAPRPTVRVVLVGDIMLGRGLSRIVRDDPEGVFRDVRFVLSDADLAGGNLESPLTRRPHVASNPYALEADPNSARAPALAGFDVLGLANNHAGDAGRASVLDTIEAVEEHGMVPVGGGANIEQAHTPVIREVRGLHVGFLAFDATRAGTPATEIAAGIAPWEDVTVREAVTKLRPSVDVLVVAVHGGVEYRTWTDPYMATLAEKLHDWGVDVVWGSGPHVVQPVYVIDGDRPTVVATSLGNFIFDQGDRRTKEGAILEVLADGEGVTAYRVGVAEHRDRRVHFEQWGVPSGDAVLIGSDWWALVRPSPNADGSDVVLDDFRWGDVIDATIGDADGDGSDDLAVVFRRPYRESPVRSLFPDRPWTDALGRTVHVGLFRPGDQRPEWIAGAVFQPVARIMACDGSMAVAYEEGGVSGWRWNGFGFLVAPALDGPYRLGCADVDGDGARDPVFQELGDEG